MKFYRINALLLKYFYININRADRLFDIFYWPTIDLFVWGFTSFYIKELSNFNILSMLIGGIILWTFVWRASQDIAVFVLEDFWSRNLYHLFSSPLKVSEHIISIILVGFLRSLATFLFLSLFAFLLYSFNIFNINIIVLGIAVLLLSMFGWIMGMFVTSFIMRYGQRIQVIAWSTVWIIQPFTCVFYPLSSMPSWAAKIAVFIPTTYVFEAMRESLSGNPITYSNLFYSAILTVILFIATALFLRASFKKARMTGLLARGD